MTRHRLRKAIWLSLCLLGFVGCGPRLTGPPAANEETTSPPPTSHEIGESTIRVVDPKGRWTFEAQAQLIEADSVAGPYVLEPADCRYQEHGKPPIVMRAARAHLDEQAKYLILESNVWISSGAWVLEAERVEYDLSAGEVVALGQTKWTFTNDQIAGKDSESLDEGKSR